MDWCIDKVLILDPAKELKSHGEEERLLQHEYP